jgi:hypothetical protein
MADGAIVVGFRPAMGIVVSSIDPKGAALPITAAGLAWLPPGALLGAVYGAATGVEDGEIQDAIQIAAKFAKQWDFEAELVRTISDRSWSEHGIGVNPYSPTGPDPAHVALGHRGFRHIIELELGRATLDGDYSLRNPRVCLKVNGTAKLYRLHGTRREEVHMVNIDYRSDKQRFVRWMAEDAKTLRAEVDKCQRTIAAQILEAFAE